MTTKKKSSRRSRRSRHGNAVRQRETTYTVTGVVGSWTSLAEAMEAAWAEVARRVRTRPPIRNNNRGHMVTILRDDGTVAATASQCSSWTERAGRARVR